VQDTTFYNIKSSEYRLSGDSTIRISGTDLGNALISHDSSATTISQ
jgi:hypothetical protein